LDYRVTFRHNSTAVILEAADLPEYMVEKWCELEQRTLSEQEYFAVALSGGRTPITFYRRLSEEHRGEVWNHVHVFLSDERYVPFSHPDSNYGMLSELLLNEVRLPPANRHPVPVQEATLEMAARKYEEDIRQFFKLRRGMFPEFDLIMLGMGEDGHTASLFPGHDDALNERERLVYPVKEAPKKYQRLTLTLPVINNAKNIVFLITGKEKANAVREVMENKNPSLPASMVRPIKGTLFFVLDSDAASLLSAEFRRQYSMVTR
jgi:6-phosphogluconolactonase